MPILGSGLKKMGGLGTSRSYVSNVLAIPNLLSYHKFTDASGNMTDSSGNGYTGVVGGTLQYANLAGPSAAMGSAPRFSGDDYVNFYSAGYAGAWNGGELTVGGWVRSDGNFSGRYCGIRVDANNRILLYCTAATTIQAFYIAGGTGISRDMTSLTLNTWMHICMTVSKVANEMKAYVNGVQIGATQAVAGTWAGSLASTQVCWGAENTSPGTPFTGYLAHMVTFARALTGAEVTTLATPI